MESASVDDDVISTTINNKDINNDINNSNDDNLIFWYIICFMSGIILICLVSICIYIMVIFNNKHQKTKDYVKAQHKGLELEQTKPDPIKIITSTTPNGPSPSIP